MSPSPAPTVGDPYVVCEHVHDGIVVSLIHYARPHRFLVVNGDGQGDHVTVAWATVCLDCLEPWVKVPAEDATLRRFSVPEIRTITAAREALHG